MLMGIVQPPPSLRCLNGTFPSLLANAGRSNLWNLPHKCFARDGGICLQQASTTQACFELTPPCRKAFTVNHYNVQVGPNPAWDPSIKGKESNRVLHLEAVYISLLKAGGKWDGYLFPPRLLSSPGVFG